MKIKIVEWQGKISPIWKEIGEIDAFECEIGWNAESEELSIDINDLLDCIKYRR